MPLVIIDNYDSFTFNLYQLLQELSAEPVAVYRNDQITFAQLQALKPSGVIISPGPGHPANPTDFGICAEIIKRAADLTCPILGVCLGHQGIVHHLGGKISQAPTIVHGKTSRIKHNHSSPLFAGLPEQISVMRYHSLIASEEEFPDNLEVCAREETLGLIMAVQHRRQPLFGVQFHPESIGTPQGRTILENFVALC